MTHPSLDTLLLEAAEDRGYAKGYVDGGANNRVRGRDEGLLLARKQIAQALQREGIELTIIAKVINLPL